LVECIASRGCMVPSDYSDECADIRQEHVLQFSDIAVLEGHWKKIFTNGGDLWPCQQTHFFPPGVSEPEPLPWLTSWPKEPDVWQMDLSWAFQPSGAKRFTMSSELYPNARWKHGGTTADPTLKTLAHMWGTTAEENWHVLYSGKDMLLMHVCAYFHERHIHGIHQVSNACSETWNESTPSEPPRSKDRPTAATSAKNSRAPTSPSYH
jgi:hypothetical protein